MEEKLKQLGKALKFLAKMIIELIKLPFRLLNALFDSNKTHETAEVDKEPEHQKSIELIGKPYEKLHYELALEGEFEKQSLIFNQEVDMYFALINPKNKINTKRYAICPQASLGELFNVVGFNDDKEKNHKYRKSFESKRADIAIIDKDNGFTLVSLIEIIGPNHDLRGKLKSRYRDEAIKVICKKSRVLYHEYFESDNTDISSWINEQLSYLQLTN